MKINRAEAMVSFVVEKKFEVKFEGSHGGTWISVAERSRGRVSVVGFEREEIEEEGCGNEGLHGLYHRI